MKFATRFTRSILASALLAGLAVSAAASATDLAPQNMAISMTLDNSCDLSVSDTDLGAYGGGSGITDSGSASGHVGVVCNLNTAYSVAVDDGQNLGAATVAPTDRAMSDGNGHFIPYELFTDATNTTLWSSLSPITGIGSGQFQNLTFGMSFSNATLAPGGVYSDTVALTLSYN